MPNSRYSSSDIAVFRHLTTMNHLYSDCALMPFLQVCLTDFCLAQVNGTYSLWTLCNSDLKDGVDWKWVNGNHTAISDFNKVQLLLTFL